ncbi:extracellular serine rich protein [Aspergillus saccharolyticus JOP 1030-1]|uniref:Extracellular membrane protein CFEM domain-containing protein n=1 Tax=Aspergillus saccharolyticus JOP 1030-1 TaxID=1450539 RepID=A0A318Z7G4_9EURO|nr:hypothetical protein BP01DRAFT_394246 [Aspergillus saccharolyticus JOP 1030-1]PYH42364.1 hypothetical protein BP01DRAFT_394246 [Aspergillus saccharolyticus JOP 1030-1]
MRTLLLLSTIPLATATASTDQELGYLQCASAIAQTYHSPQCTSPSALDCFCNAPFDPAALDQGVLEDCQGEGVDIGDIPRYICDDASVPVSPRKGSVPMVRLADVDAGAGAGAQQQQQQQHRGSLPMVRVNVPSSASASASANAVSSSAAVTPSSSRAVNTPSSAVPSSAVPTSSIASSPRRASQPLMRVDDTTNQAHTQRKEARAYSPNLHPNALPLAEDALPDSSLYSTTSTGTGTGTGTDTQTGTGTGAYTDAQPGAYTDAQPGAYTDAQTGAYAPATESSAAASSPYTDPSTTTQTNQNTPEEAAAGAGAWTGTGAAELAPSSPPLAAGGLAIPTPTAAVAAVAAAAGADAAEATAAAMLPTSAAAIPSSYPMTIRTSNAVAAKATPSTSTFSSVKLVTIVPSGVPVVTGVAGSGVAAGAGSGSGSGALFQGSAAGRLRIHPVVMGLVGVIGFWVVG